MEISNEILAIATLAASGGAVRKEGERVLVRGSAITPQLYALNGGEAAHGAGQVVDTGVGVGEDNVNVEVFRQVLAPQVTLETCRAFRRGEFVFHFDGGVVDDLAIGGGVANAVGLAEGHKELHLGGVGVGSVLAVEGDGVDL